jgi:hypothetical protein
VGRVIAVAVALAAALVVAATAAAQDGAVVPYTTIDSGHARQYTARTTLVIRDRRRYRNVWRRLQSSLPTPRRPRIDFRRRTLIAVLRGSGTGLGLDLESVTREEGGLVVHVVDARAGAGCVVPQSFVNRYELISVPRTAGPIRTERVEQVHDCA